MVCQICSEQSNTMGGSAAANRTIWKTPWKRRLVVCLVRELNRAFHRPETVGRPESPASVRTRVLRCHRTEGWQGVGCAQSVVFGVVLPSLEAAFWRVPALSDMRKGMPVRRQLGHRHCSSDRRPCSAGGMRSRNRRDMQATHTLPFILTRHHWPTKIGPATIFSF